jgi:hypothetical protein
VNMQTKDHLWFMHDQALHYIVFLQFGHSWTKCFQNNG